MTVSFATVRTASQWVCENADSVTIHQDKLEQLLPLLKQVSQQAWYESIPLKINKDDFESALRFSLMFNATSFCYWKKPRWRINHQGQDLGGAFSLTTCYASAVNKNENLLIPEQWLHIDQDQYLSITAAQSGIPIPLAAERVKALHAMGLFLSQNHDNSVQNFIAYHDHDAKKILSTLAGEIYGFDDVHSYKGKTVPFFKRAQLALADISSLCSDYTGSPLKGSELITACADYKLPQIMRYYGLISYCDALAKTIDNEAEILSGSAEEVEIRAATIHVVELLRQKLQEKDIALTSNQISDQIWLLSQDQPADIQPYHHTVTVHY